MRFSQTYVLREDECKIKNGFKICINTFGTIIRDTMSEVKLKKKDHEEKEKKYGGLLK